MVRSYWKRENSLKHESKFLKFCWVCRSVFTRSKQKHKEHKYVWITLKNIEEIKKSAMIGKNRLNVIYLK